MFKKPQQEIQTIIGADTSIKGEINSKGTVRIDGDFEGTLEADWVIVGESGRIRGDIRSRGTIIGGRVEGNVNSTEIIEIKHKAEVYGEICTQRLSVSEGAIFDGKVCMQKADSNKKEEKIPE